MCEILVEHSSNLVNSQLLNWLHCGFLFIEFFFLFLSFFVSEGRFQVSFISVKYLRACLVHDVHRILFFYFFSKRKKARDIYIYILHEKKNMFCPLFDNQVYLFHPWKPLTSILKWMIKLCWLLLVRVFRGHLLMVDCGSVCAFVTDLSDVTHAVFPFAYEVGN